MKSKAVVLDYGMRLVSLCVGCMMNWRPVPSVPRLLPSVRLDGLQPPRPCIDGWIMDIYRRHCSHRDMLRKTNRAASHNKLPPLLYFLSVVSF